MAELQDNYLFRAKAKNGPWHIGLLACIGYGECCIRDNENRVRYTDTDSLCPCSGLKDINDVLMFAEDIIRAEDGQIGVVRYGEFYLQMKERIRFLENINGITDHNLSTARQKMKKLEKIIQQLQEKIRKLNEEKKNPPHNARNAGRRKNDPEMIKQLSRFQNLIQEGHCKTEIMKKMGISDATYYRYKKRSADI